MLKVLFGTLLFSPLLLAAPAIPDRNDAIEVVTKDGNYKVIKHPEAAKGLIRINEDGSYQYKVPRKEKSAAASMQFAILSSPEISNDDRNLNFTDMYGANPWAIMFSYEWQMRGFGSLGLQTGGGFSTFTGKGRLVSNGEELDSEERFTLFLVPVTLNLVYRFEYSSKQWLIPYLIGGGTYYGLLEKRDDSNKFSYGAAPAVGGGGGIHFSVTRFDHKTAFTLDREYGIADMWITVEAKALQGLNPDLDFTSAIISSGITVDF